MARMNWKRTLLAVAASLGLGAVALPTSWAQTPVADRVVTVGLNGQNHRCKVILDWNLPDGSKAFKVRTLDTGETLTLVREATEDASGKQSTVRIYRWTEANASPEGAPRPPRIIQTQATAQAPVFAPAPQPQTLRQPISELPPPVITEGPRTVVETRPVPMIDPRDPAPWSPPISPLAQQPGKTTSTTTIISPHVKTAPTTACLPAPTTVCLPEPSPACDQQKLSLVEQLRFHLNRNALPVQRKANQETIVVMESAPRTVVANTNAAGYDRTRLGNGSIVTQPNTVVRSDDGASQGFDRTRTGVVGSAPISIPVPQPLLASAMANPQTSIELPAPPIAPASETILVGQSSAPAPTFVSPDASGKVVKVTETIIQLDPSSAKAEIARSAAMQAPALPTPTEVVITTGPQDPPRAAVATNPNESTGGTRRFPGLFKGNRPQQANAFTPPVQANTQPIMMPIASAPPMAYPTGVLQAGFFPNDPNFVMERGDPNAFQSNDPRVAQLIKIMTDGLLPSQREWAVMRLAECDSRVHPVVHAIFAHYAVHDQSGSVRAACIHQLGRTNAPIPFAYRVVNALRNDPDVRVQTEVGEIAIRYKVR